MSCGMEEAARSEREDQEASAKASITAESVARERINYALLTVPGLELSPASPRKEQVGGTHYLTMKIQPLEFATANHLDFFQKDILKYITRRKGDKAKRIEDLRKASHYLAMYIEAVESGACE